MIATDTNHKLGITVAKAVRTVMQGKGAIADEASYEGPGKFSTAQLIAGQRWLVAFCESSRDVQEAVRVICCWDPTSQKKGELHRQWAEDVSKALAPMALPGGYPNMLGPDASEQIRFAYGSNAERLRAAKKLFDPDDVFSSATPLGVR